MIRKNETSDQGSTIKQWLVAILANSVLFSYGLQCGWVAVAAKVLQSESSPTGSALSDNEISWLASALSFSATIAVGIFAYLVDRFGRKMCIMIIAVFQAIGWIIKLCPATTATLILARISCGIAGGGCFSVIPMYVKEISQDSLRGTLGMILIIAQNTGILLVFAMGGYLAYDTVLWIVVGLPIFTIVGMIKAPESPSYLVKIGDIDKAAATIAFLRGRTIDDKVVQNEIDVTKREDERFKSLPSISYAQIFKHKAWGRGFTIMIMIMTCHGLNGGFSIITYASIILGQCGVTISPELQSLAIPTFMILGSLLSMVGIERLGRKFIICSSFLVSGVSFGLLSGMLLAQRLGGWVPGWLPTVVIVTAVCAYAVGVSPMPFVIMSEMFNFQIRAKVMGVLVTLGWLFSFVQLLAYNPITSNYGAHISFFCFAVINLLGASIILVLLPETKGKTAEEIELVLEKRVKKPNNTSNEQML